ncbi:MAG TPA: hypothetical protein VL854_12850, partial [Nitrososphaeraceae archaeon]|nr:hypothetical protein [Nitrososphaeraceae archaeon]
MINTSTNFENLSVDQLMNNKWFHKKLRFEFLNRRKSLKLRAFFLESESQFRTDSVVGTDGPVNYSSSYTSGNIISAETSLVRNGLHDFDFATPI